MKSHLLPRLELCVILAAGLVACSSNTTPNGSGSGGTSQATTSTGGAMASGGTPVGSGGTASTGGVSGSGGVSATGGKGGASSSGGGSGGGSGSGGATNTGGSSMASGGVGAGGTPASTGGANGMGGVTATDAGAGGRTGAGGVTALDAGAGTGGRTAAGGATGVAGMTGAGGVIGAGGASATGGTPSTGGSSGGFSASYLLGADVTNAESASSAAQDSLLALMKAHGLNAVRLRTFVDPKAADGYDKTNGTADIAHTVAFGKKIKDAGMALLVDFHYSDNWADPGKQCVPIAWQSYTTITDLATALHDYTKDSITKLIAGGARPDMVQIGNETTPGMLLHVCDSGGQPTGSNKVTGSISNWTNLGTLFKAGVQGVKDVDTGILIALHIDRGGDKPTETAGSALSTSKNYINNAVKQGVSFDVFGESCYQQYQGDPNSASNTKTGWTNTLGGLASAFPTIKIMAAEYGPLEREINDVVFGLPNQQGIGTFNWEPDTAGDWNRSADGTSHILFTRSGNTYTAAADLALYDDMKVAYASRL
jgi:arabinogalactan endo-1,4-beta-galactosidase